MASNLQSKRNSYRAERDFGLIVGGVFALLGAWWTYRGKFGAVSPWLIGGGGLLFALGLAWPRGLVSLNRWWMKLAEAMSFVMTHIILAIVFFLVVLPIGLVKRLTGYDPLRRRAKPAESYWRPYRERQRDKRHYEKMY
jgi:hypothetical protein